MKSLSNFQNPFQITCLLSDNHLSQTTHLVISSNKLLKAHLKMLQQKDVKLYPSLALTLMMIQLRQPLKILQMKTCYEMLYTPKEQDWPSFQISSNEANWLLKKKGLINKSLGFIFIQIGCLGRCSTSFSNWVSSQRLTTHHLLKPQTSKFSNMSGRWLIAHMDTSSIKKNFLSMDFKPLQIHELQAFSNPLPKLYIRGSSLHRKAKATIK